MTFTIGLDIGTSGAKGLLVDEHGRVITSALSEYPMSSPKPLWSEQNPEDWWNATQNVLHSLVHQSKVSPQQVIGVGLTGQMHGLILLDEAGRVLRPCIMWNDQRTAVECKEITAQIGFNRLLELTANPILPGFTAPKILWVRKHEPDVYKYIAHILLPKDFIRYKLTGEFATDVSDASGMALLDVKRRRWSGELLSALEIPERWMPGLSESVSITGKVTNQAAIVTGLCAGTPVVGGAGDQAAGAVGSGIVKPGVVSVTVGTSGVVFAHMDQMVIEQQGRLHAFCHAVPNGWHLMGVTLSAGGSLRWFRDELCAEEKRIASSRGIDPYEVMMEEASQVKAGSEGLFFLPYLSGERTPYPDPHAKGTFIGLTVRHTKAHMIRSVLEGVTFSLRDCLELVRGMNIHTNQIVVSGGGARSPLWRQILADVFNKEIITVTSTEGAPYGAALLAAVGVGIHSTVQAACDTEIQPSSVTFPNSRTAEIYDRYYTVYRNAYPTLRTFFKELSSL